MNLFTIFLKKNTSRLVWLLCIFLNQIQGWGAPRFFAWRRPDWVLNDMIPDVDEVFSDWEKDWNLSSFIFRVSRWSLLVGQFTFLVLLILVTFSVFKVKNKCNVKYWNIWYYIVLQFLLNGIKLFWFSTCMSPLAWWSLLGASNQIQTCLNAWIEMTHVWMSQQKLLFKENEACPIYPNKKSGAIFLTYLNAWTKINEDK